MCLDEDTGTGASQPRRGVALHPGDAAGAHPMGGGYQGGDDTSDIGRRDAERGTHSVLRLGGGGAILWRL